MGSFIFSGKPVNVDGEPCFGEVQMLNAQPRVGKATIVIVGLLAAIAIVPWTRGTGWSQTRATSQAESLAAWEKIATVLQHPRCLNCHQLDSPLQGDTRRPHISQVVRGPDATQQLT